MLLLGVPALLKTSQTGTSTFTIWSAAERIKDILVGQNVMICTFFMSIILFFWFKRWILFQLSIKCSSIVCIQSKKSLIAWTFFVLEVDIGLMDPFLAWATHLRDSLVSNILISCTQIYIASITHDNIQPFLPFSNKFP